MTDKQIKETKTCKYCGNTFNCDEYVIHCGWVKCPQCKEPICDVTIQDDNHWSKTNNLKKLDFMEGFMQGFM